MDFSLYGFNRQIDDNLKAIRWLSPTLTQHDILRWMEKKADLYAVANKGEGKLSAALLGLVAKFSCSEKPKAKLVGAVVLPEDAERRKTVLAIAKAVSRKLDIEIVDLGADDVRQLPSLRPVVLLGTVGDFAKAPLSGRPFDAVIFDRYPQSLECNDEAARKFKCLYAKDIMPPQTIFLAETFDEKEYAAARQYSQKLKRSSTFRHVGDPDIREEFIFANARELFPTLLSTSKRKDLGIFEGRTLVVASSRYRADKAYDEIAERGLPIAQLQASSPGFHEEILNYFDNGRISVICCTFSEIKQVLNRTFDTVIFIGPAKSANDYQNVLSVVLKNDEDLLATGPGRAYTFVSTREFGDFLKLEAELGYSLRLWVTSNPSTYDIPVAKIASHEFLKNSLATFKANASERIKAHRAAIRLDKRIDKKILRSRTHQIKPLKPLIEEPLESMSLSSSGEPDIVIVAGVEVPARDADAFARSLLYGPEALKTGLCSSPSSMAYARAKYLIRGPKEEPVIEEVPAQKYGTILHFSPLGENAEKGDGQLIVSDERLPNVVGAMKHAEQSAVKPEILIERHTGLPPESPDLSPRLLESDKCTPQRHRSFNNTPLGPNLLHTLTSNRKLVELNAEKAKRAIARPAAEEVSGADSLSALVEVASGQEKALPAGFQEIFAAQKTEDERQEETSNVSRQQALEVQTELLDPNAVGDGIDADSDDTSDKAHARQEEEDLEEGFYSDDEEDLDEEESEDDSEEDSEEDYDESEDDVEDDVWSDEDEYGDDGEEDGDDEGDEFEEDNSEDEGQEVEAAPVRRTLTIRSGYVPKKHIEQEITITEPLSSSGAALRAAQAAERRAVGKTGEALTHQLIGKKVRKNARIKGTKRQKGILYSNALPGMGGLNLEKPSTTKKTLQKNGKNPLAKKSKQQNQKFKNQQYRQRKPHREEQLDETRKTRQLLSVDASTTTVPTLGMLDAAVMPTQAPQKSVQKARQNQRKQKYKTGLKQKRMPVLSKAALADMTPESLAEMADEDMGGQFGGEAASSKMQPNHQRVRTPRSMRLKHQRTAPQNSAQTLGVEDVAPASSGASAAMTVASLYQPTVPTPSQFAGETEDDGGAAPQKAQIKTRDDKRRFPKKKMRQQPRDKQADQVDQAARFATDEDNFGNSVHYRPKTGGRKTDFSQPASTWSVADPFAQRTTTLTFSQSTPAQGDGYRSLFGESLTAPMAAPGMKQAGKEKRWSNGNKNRKDMQPHKGLKNFKSKKPKIPKSE